MAAMKQRVKNLKGSEYFPYPYIQYIYILVLHLSVKINLLRVVCAMMSSKP